MGRSKVLATAVALTGLLVACGSGDGSVGGGAAPDEAGLALRYGALRERTLDVIEDGSHTTAAIGSLNAFSVDLFKAIASEDAGNVVISPYSVTFALGMIFAGANGPTADEMAAVLRIDQPATDWHEGLNAYDLTLDARTSGSPTSWSAANKVWAQPGLALRDDYLDTLTGIYGSPLAEADFAGDPESQREVINTWIKNRTEDLIPELFPPGSISPAARMALVNAVALDAPWEFPFDPEATSDGPFTTVDGTHVQVPMMHYNEFLPSALEEGSHQAVELPYGGGVLSMVVIVPEDFETFTSTLTTEKLDGILGSIADGGIHLSLPRWQSRTHLRLNDVLADLGMPTAFGPFADFSKMTEGEHLWLDFVEHEAYIEVDEKGTRAAAATGGVMVGSHGPTIEVNRPFLYVIRDKGAGTILFIGQVTDPRT